MKLRKRLGAWLLALTLCLSMLPAGPALAAETQSGTCGDNLTWTLEGDTLTISGTGPMTEFSRSPFPKGYSNVVITEGVTSIGDWAFSTYRGGNYFDGSTCNGALLHVEIPSTVTSIGKYAFACCTSLVSVTLPESVTSIGDHAFYYCTALKYVNIPDGVERLVRTFGDCDALKTIEIPGSVRDLSGAFKGCYSLDGVTLAEGVQNLSEAFSDCANLEEITIPSSVTSLDSAFQSCRKLRQVTFSTPTSLERLGDKAFSSCSSLKDIEIPEGIKTIGTNTFYGSGLSSITLPTSLEVIESSNFYYDPYGSDSSSLIVNYGGTLTQWDALSILDWNDGLDPAVVRASDATQLRVRFSPSSGCPAIFAVIGKPYGELPTPTKENYNFLGWFTQETGGEQVTADTIVTQETGHTLYAHWLGKELSVSFDPQGGSLDQTSKVCYYNESYGALPTPTKPGFTFDGWYTEKEGGRKVTSTSKVNEMGTQTLYARWGSSKGTVTLDPRGGNVSTRSLSVQSGGVYGTLPTPTRTGYDFQGWFTAAEGGKQITAASTVETVGKHTLYAHWLGKTFTVTLDPNGGAVSPTTKSVRMDETYGTLPTPTRAGYTFDGWYPSSYGSGKVTSSTKMTTAKDHTLTARWLGKTFTVTLDPNGGTVSSNTLQVSTGSIYGYLPTPTRSGYTFDGWYTSASGGQQVSGSSVVQTDRDHTLYAHWTQQVLPMVQQLSYKFSNSSYSFGYSGSYRIPYERYELIFGDTALARSAYKSQGSWRGSCFGMASTAGMFYQKGNGVNTADFNSSAGRPYDLSTKDRSRDWNVTVQEFIEAMQVSQYGSLIQRDYSGNKNQYAKLAQAVTACQNGGEPVSVAIFSGGSGHALLGYKLERANSLEDRLMVYDCNYPNQEKYVILYKDEYGSYDGWRYDPLGWSGGAGKSGWISYVPYSHFMQVWNDRAGAMNRGMSLLKVSAASATVYDMEGAVAATIRDGKVTTDRSDVYPLISLEVTADGAEAASQTSAVWLPTSLYTVVSDDKGSDPLEATMVNVEQSASVSTTGKKVTFAVDDSLGLNYVELPQIASRYSITLDSSMEVGFGDVQLSGEAGDKPLVFAQVSGKLYAQGAELGGGALKIDGEAATTASVSGETPDVNALLQEKPISFRDVADGSWYAEAVRFVTSKKLFNGTGADAFSPNDSMSRAMLMTVLARYAGADTTGGSVWYEKGMVWAKENGVSDGTDPNGLVTREQIATMLYRLVGSPASSADALSAFPDQSSVSGWAQDAMAWAVEKGIIKGANGLLNPAGLASRAEVATMLMRFCQL